METISVSIYEKLFGRFFMSEFLFYWLFDRREKCANILAGHSNSFSSWYIQFIIYYHCFYFYIFIVLLYSMLPWSISHFSIIFIMQWNHIFHNNRKNTRHKQSESIHDFHMLDACYIGANLFWKITVSLLIFFSLFLLFCSILIFIIIIVVWLVNRTVTVVC